MTSARPLVRLLVVVCALAGCGPRAPEPSLLVILVDALRADHLGCYGYARDTSPRLDAFAASGTRFAQAVSHSPWTLPSMGTLWTGLYPTLHDAVLPSDGAAWARDRATFRPVNVLDESRVTLAEVLRDHGFATAGFVNGAYGGKVFGMGQGFGVFEDDGLPGLRWTTEALLAWLDRERPPRFFAYLHAMHVHSPYAPPAGPIPATLPEPERRRMEEALAEEKARWAAVDYDPGYTGTVDGSALYLLGLKKTGAPPPPDLQRLKALYDAGIHYTDWWIGHLLDELTRRGLLEHTVVIVTADHGEEFFEHGGIEHTRTHYEELARIPLVFHGPGVPAGKVVEAPVGLIDVFPTVLQLLGVEWGGFLQGRSLVPLMEGRPEEPRALYLEGSQTAGLQGVRLGPQKYLRDAVGREQLYDLRSDAGERQNLCAAANAPACAPFRALLDQHDQETLRLRASMGLPPPPRAAVDPALRERLRQLGYAH